MPDLPKVEIKGVSKTYPGDKGAVQALRTVNLSIKTGEFVSIVGPSGCGKSTLLYVAGGFLPANGEVLVDGKAIAGPGTDRGVVFQEYALFPWLSVRNNILYGLERGTLPAAERARIADRLIGVIGLEGFEDRFPRELSGGMKQRVAIARTLACDPAILLARRALRRAGCADARGDAGRVVADLARDPQDRADDHPRRQRGGLSLQPHLRDVGAAGKDRRGIHHRSRPHRFRASKLFTSDAFNKVRNEVWISVRKQALAAEKMAHGS